MKRPDSEAGDRMMALEAEADARRARIVGNLNELSVRMKPANLVNEARQRAWAEVDRVTDEVLDIAEDLVHDSLDWARSNQGIVLGGTLTALISAGLVWYATRKKTVPLYAAYDMEDPMTDSDETLSAKAAGTWSKVKGEALQVGDKAGEAYYSARSRALELSEEARERAQKAADIAREKALEAADAAREAADRAREVAGEAGVWAKRQPQENPATVVLIALAAGALIGALLPSGNRSRS
jgi:ElaB/YqjD/DUF883 family membrane-anchored ribosome-binding protein